MKALSILLILLVGTMISGLPMKSYADPQLDTLINIATQARDNLGATISQINNVPDEISQLYKQGSNETDELAQAAAQQDVGLAKQHFLAAMKFFKETNDQINALNATATNDQQKTEIIQLRGEIVRLENMGNLLKSIASQNNLNINFTSFNAMLQNATQDLTSGNLDDASKQIQNANDFVIATHNSITQAAQEKNSERAKDFTEKQIAQLNVNQTTSQNTTNYYSNNASSNTSRTNVTQSNTPMNLSIQNHTVNNSDITMENNPNDMVAKLKQLVAEGKVDQAINLIKIIQAYQKAHSAQLAEVTAPTNTTVSTPLPPPPAPTNTTVSTPSLPQHQTQENQTSSGHGGEHNNHTKKHNEDTTRSKKQHNEN
ncbi:MAG TPA: hypothetical protein VJ729_06025 [Nitrososphaeraceae archaeon]|nr:hypothetical protein [Nitrososphaeraceae archaeon]